MEKNKTLVYFTTASFLFIITSLQILIPFEEYTDSLSLFNPVYMFSKYGKMVYPMHGYFDNMPVHPPLYYIIQGLFFKVFISKYISFKLPILILYLYYFFIIILSQFHWKEKVMWLISFAALTFFEPVGPRPDFILVLCFIIGLFHFENARRINRSFFDIVLGSLFFCLTSILHYFGSFAFAGVFIYIIYIFKNTTDKYKKTKIISAAFVIILIIGSYFLFQLVPNYKDIYRQIFAVKNIGNPFYSILIHHQHYLNKGLTFFIIPPILLALIPVLFIRNLRPLYFSSLPLCLFVLLFSSGKSTGYYLPEIFVFTLIAGLSLTRIVAMDKINSVVLFMGLIVSFSLLMYQGITKNSFNKSDALQIRKASQYLFGKENTIGGRMDLWYISGAKHYLNLNSFLIWNSSTIKNSDTLWTDNFDYVVEHNHMSNNTTNEFKTTILGTYLANRLQLNGYLVDPTSILKIANTVYFSKSKKQFRSIILTNDSYLIAKEDSNPSSELFVSLLVPTCYLKKLKTSGLKFYTEMPLVDSLGKPYQMSEDVKEYLVFGFTNNDSLKSLSEEIGPFLSVIETINVKWSELPKKEIDTIPMNDVIIYKNFNHLIKKQPYY